MSKAESGEVAESVERETDTKVARDDTDLSKPEVRHWVDTGIDRVDSLTRPGYIRCSISTSLSSTLQGYLI
jgi:hypothetical protein